MARRYTVGGHLGTFEVGFKARNGHKVNFVNNLYFENGNPNLTLNQTLGTFTDPNYYDHSYTMEVFGFYQGSGIYPIQREYYHPTVAAGIRWSSSAE